MCAARAHEWRGRGFQEAPPPPGTSQSLCGVLPPPSLAGRGRYICIRLAHSRSRFPGRPDCVSPAPPSCPHLARRPPAALPRAGHGSPAPLRARLEPWCCPPGSSGLIGFSRRSPGSGGRRITSQICVCVCVCARAWLATLHCNIASGEATETPWNRDRKKKKKRYQKFTWGLWLFLLFRFQSPLSSVRGSRQGKSPRTCRKRPARSPGPAAMCRAPALPRSLGTAAGLPAL